MVRENGAPGSRARMRRFLGRWIVAPTARSTPFLCSCAKKRGGAPKKRAFGCRHGRCSVPPASPTDAKPQHHSRLRQADLSPRPPPSPSPSRARNVPTTDLERSREWWSRRGKKALFFGGSTPFLWASTKEMGSNGSRGSRPPPNKTAHTQKRKEKGGNPLIGFPP